MVNCFFFLQLNQLLKAQVSFVTNTYGIVFVLHDVVSFHHFLFICHIADHSLILEPGTAPRNVEVRPLSSSTMVIQWHEPETPNGQVTVCIAVKCRLWIV